MSLPPFARLFSRRSATSTRRLALAVPLVAAGVGIVGTAMPSPAGATSPNLVRNASVEGAVDSNGIPNGFTAAGYGTNTYSFRRVSPAYSGSYAARLTVTSHKDGDRKLLASMSSGIVPGHRYSLGVFYTSTTTAYPLAFTKSGNGDWNYWFSAPATGASTRWNQIFFTTPAVPAGVTEIGFGLALASTGTLTTDLYSGADIDYSAPTTTVTTKPTTTTTKPTTTTTKPTTTTTPPPPAPKMPWATDGTTNLYVSPNGSDSNPGTKDRPFRQVQKAANTATAGTVVHVAPGDYNPIINNRGGAAGRPITFLADQLGTARINQTGIDPAWLNFSSYVDIVGFDMQAPRAHQGINNRGSYVRAFHNHMHNVFTTGSCTGGAAINHELYEGTGNAAIGNTIHEVGPVGCSLVHGVYVSNDGATVQNNLVYDVSGWLLHFYHAANRATVTNNTVFAGSTSRGAQVDGGIILCADEGNTVPADNFIVANNIIRDVPVGITECGRMGVNVGSNNKFLNNLVYNSGIPTSLKNPVSGTITADPRMVNFRADGSGDYRLTSSSPALDSGVTTGAPTFDRNLMGRPKGVAMDRGAYEGTY